MVRSKSRGAAQKRTARVLKSGGYKPSPAGRKAREAARFIGPIPVEDREIIIKVRMANWWDTGDSLDDYRKEGSADSVYDYANELESAGVPGNLINITSGSREGLYYIYAARDSG